jgi:hypothetical protein
MDTRAHLFPTVVIDKRLEDKFKSEAVERVVGLGGHEGFLTQLTSNQVFGIQINVHA